jgi:prefoldin subunit 5
MSREKKLLPDIRVSKLPNGYAFTYEGEEFMCFSPMMLVAEVMARVGGANSDEMDKGSLLHCLFEVMLGQQYAKDVDKLKATVTRLENLYATRIAKLDKQIAILDEAIAKHETMKKQLETTTELANKMSDAYKDAYKPYDEYNKRITKLEGDTMKMESHFKSATAQASTLLKEINQTLAAAKRDERELSARATQLVSKLELRDTISKHEPAGDAEWTEEEPAGDAAGTVVTEQPADEGGNKPDKSGGTKRGRKPAIKHSAAITTRGKGGRNKAADAKVLAEMEKQLQEHWNEKGIK